MSMAVVMTEHLKMEGLFWGLGALDMLGNEQVAGASTAKWVMACFDEKRGGFGGNVGHDASLLFTQHAVYVLAQCNANVMAWPTDQIDNTVHPNDAQRAKLDALKSALSQGADTIKAACPTEVPPTPPDRLAAIGAEAFGREGE